MLSAIAFLALQFPERPAEGRFIADGASLLKAEDADAIRALCREALAKKRVPILIATVEQLPKRHGAPEEIELAAQRLFARWGIGSQDWNFGILLLVSTTDRKARIELGAGWAGTNDADCRKIMDELIVPRFKKSEFSAGILEGVKGLHAMALDLPIPRGAWHQRHFNWMTAFWWGLFVFILVVITRNAMDRTRAPGCLGFGGAWVAAFFAFWLTRSSGGGSSSFGGGSGGGGGATGSW